VKSISVLNRVEPWRTKKKALPDVSSRASNTARVSKVSVHDAHEYRPAGAGMMVVPVMVQRHDHFV
jgi:hypothetical protein